MELKKPHPSKLAGGVETQNGLVPYPCGVDKNFGGISQEQGVPAPQQAPQSGVPVPQNKFHNFWLKKTAETEVVEETSGVPSSFS